MVIHSYMLAKRLMKMQDHIGGARMLNRVAKNISQFPMHMINILTSTVAECTKAGLKKAAFDWACVLVRPENRNQIAENFKKRIENIARKPIKQEDDPEITSPCPFCKASIPETVLECINCKNNIPYCIASGK
jgi:WD repeat-containing protein 19